MVACEIGTKTNENYYSREISKTKFKRQCFQYAFVSL